MQFGRQAAVVRFEARRAVTPDHSWRAGPLRIGVDKVSRDGFRLIEDDFPESGGKAISLY